MIDQADSGVERARLALLVDHLNQAILMETPQRRVARTNQAFCTMFQIPAPPEALIGGDCVEAALTLAPLFGDIEAFLARVDELIADWRTVTDERITLTDGRLLERDFLPVTHADGSREIAWVYRDVTEWERLRSTAESSAQQNAELLSAISHDVRTPVTGIVGLIELLHSQPIDARTRQMVDSVRQSAASLTTMLDDFLDAARADAGLLEVKTEPVPVDALVESVTDMVGPLARAKGLILITGTAPDLPPRVMLDPGRVRQILLNVVSNAVKFTAAGVVALTAEADSGDIVFTCRDTGPGLGSQPPDDVFRAFVRGTERQGRVAAGAGLGLAIASKLAEVMGGSLRVAATGPSGSTFVLRLPLVAAPGTPSSAGPLQGQRVSVLGPELAVAALELSLARAGAEVVPDGAEVTVLISPDVPVSAPGAGRTVVLAAVEPFRIPLDATGVWSVPISEAALTAAVLGVESDAPPDADLSALPTGTHVLVVEDDPTNRVLISRMIEVLGVTCTTVADGVAALEAVALDQFDVVLMDIHLPGLDGVETTGLIRQRRAETSSDRLPVIAMTGSSGWTDPQAMLRSGFDGKLNKPMTLAQLHACLAETLTGSGQVPATAGESLDLAVLATLASDIGDEDLVRETVRTYLTELPHRMDAMATAIGSGDPKQVKETAHSLKSASAMLGATHMAQLCADIERAAAGESISDAPLQSAIAEAHLVSAAMADYVG